MDGKRLCLWHKGKTSHAKNMITTSAIHLPFAELPSEARTLFFIFAVGSLAGFGASLPKPSDIHPALEIVWNWNSLCLEDLQDPSRMTKLLKGHFSSVTTATTKKGPQ